MQSVYFKCLVYDGRMICVKLHSSLTDILTFKTSPHKFILSVTGSLMVDILAHLPHLGIVINLKFIVTFLW